MSHPAIKVEGLSKRYVLGKNERAGSFREAVTQSLTAPFRRLRSVKDGGGDHEFWALKDVNFEVQPGEVVGVIGRNGAGKSTLLKILSRITPPTSGSIRLRGRVASLLEVGTGFHPELTGRENIYLNGAMLGMRREEITRKFDEIVAFSEVEKFLDTPVKRYSSGMYVRLAFAVAAHLEPEILIVDEVLAVGDAAFQKKCLGKMKEVSTSSGRTVLFVSHNMAAIRTLCTTAVALQNGMLAFSGSTNDVVNHYLRTSSNGSTSANLVKREDRGGNGRVRLTAMRVLSGESGEPAASFFSGRSIVFEGDYVTHGPTPSSHIMLDIATRDGIALARLETILLQLNPVSLGRSGTFKCVVPSLPFPNGDYVVHCKIAADYQDADVVDNAAFFSIDGCLFYPAMTAPGVGNGLVLIDHDWNLSIVEQDHDHVVRS